MPDYVKDRQDAVEWARKMLGEQFCVLDTETTGVDSQAELVEITIIDQDGNCLLQRRCKPTVSIPIDASAVHHITDADVEHCPSAAVIWSEIEQALQGRTVVIYNAPYDMHVLEQTRLKYPGLNKLDCGRVEDAMLWYSQYVGDWNHKFGNYRWQKLPAGDHSALGDVTATLSVMKKMAAG